MSDASRTIWRLDDKVGVTCCPQTSTAPLDSQPTEPTHTTDKSRHPNGPATRFPCGSVAIVCLLMHSNRTDAKRRVPLQNFQTCCRTVKQASIYGENRVILPRFSQGEAMLFLALFFGCTVCTRSTVSREGLVQSTF